MIMSQTTLSFRVLVSPKSFLQTSKFFTLITNTFLVFVPFTPWFLLSSHLSLSFTVGLSQSQNLRMHLWSVRMNVLSLLPDRNQSNLLQIKRLTKQILPSTIYYCVMCVPAATCFRQLELCNNDVCMSTLFVTPS